MKATYIESDAVSLHGAQWIRYWLDSLSSLKTEAIVALVPVSEKSEKKNWFAKQVLEIIWIQTQSAW